MPETAEAPIINALAPWFGSKRNLAPDIVAALGSHRVYWEPFCGSLAVLLAKPPCVMETANDLHGDLINLARALKDEDLAVKLYGCLSRVVFHEDLFNEAKARIRDRREFRAPEIADVGRATDFMICSWFGRNGTIGTAENNNSFCVRYTANGGHAAKRWHSAVASIPAWHARLCNMTILNRDAFTIIERIDDIDGTVIYCDPPYLVKGSDYLHDFASNDHKRLAELLCRFQRTRVVVSYYEHPDLAALYPGWNKRSIEVTKALVQQGQRDRSGATKAIEVLLTNDRQGTLF